MHYDGGLSLSLSLLVAVPSLPFSLSPLFSAAAAVHRIFVGFFFIVFVLGVSFCSFSLF